MVIDMNEAKLETIEQIQDFLMGTADVTFSIPADEPARRALVASVLKRFSYFRRRKAHRSVLLAYRRRMTGYSRQHLSRLLVQFRDTHSLVPLPQASRTSFARHYGPAEVALLAETDSLHDTLSGPATKVLLQRAFTLFGDTRFARRSQISVSHLYNLRASQRIVSNVWSGRVRGPRAWLSACAKRRPRRACRAIFASIPCTRVIRTG